MGPIDLLQRTGNEIAYPIVRDMDTFMYERQSHEAMEVGSYAHRPILVRPDDIPSPAVAERSPTELPFTAGDFAPQLERAREIMGELLAGSEMQYSVNGSAHVVAPATPHRFDEGRPVTARKRRNRVLDRGRVLERAPRRLVLRHALIFGYGPDLNDLINDLPAPHTRHFGCDAALGVEATDPSRMLPPPSSPR